MTSGEPPGLERDPGTMGSPLVSHQELMLLVLLALLSGIRGDCGPPPKLNNAIPYTKLHGESFLPMQSVNYKCLDGFYNIYGKLDVVTCLPDSQWSPIEEFCERTCVKPPRSRFARIKSEDIMPFYPAESNVSFICRPGYNTIPGINSVITCLKNYTWTALPVFCEGKPCGDPGKPENGDTVILTNLLYLAKVDFICKEGYRLKGLSSAQCLLQGDGVQWKPNPPECLQITCFPPPNVTNASHNGSSTGNFGYNSTITYQCDYGFSLIGEASVRCTTEDNVHGVWRGSAPECKGVCPRPPRQPHASIRDVKDSYAVGSVVRYICIPGYQYVTGAVPTIECLPTSTWSTIPQVCDRKRCKVPVIDNGRFDGPEELAFGVTITFSCDEGYRLLGHKTSRCSLIGGSKVEWDKSPPYCERIPCTRPPEISNGRHSGDVALDHYANGDVVTYYCNRDFSLIGHPSITCITAEDGVNGKWDRPPPECKGVRCTPPFIANGRQTTRPLYFYTYDHVLQFVCNPGYTMVGSEFVKCGADSRWHPRLPTCVKGIITTTTTTTTTTGGGDGPPVGPTIRPTSETTDGNIPSEAGPPVGPTIRPPSETTDGNIPNEAGSSPSPGGTVPSSKPESSNIAGIVIGAVVGFLGVAAAIFAFIKFRPRNTDVKSDSHPATSDSYHAVSRSNMGLKGT